MSAKESRSSVADYGSKTDNYSWDQTQEEVTISVPLGKELKAKGIAVSIKTTHLQVGIKGQPLTIDGDLGGKVKKDECTWYLVDGSTVELTFQKVGKDWWKSAIVGEAEIDLDLIEGSKYLDDSLLKKIKEQKQQQKEESKKAGENPTNGAENITAEKITEEKKLDAGA